MLAVTALGIAGRATAGGLSFFPTPPCRAVDTRVANLQAPALTANEFRVFTLSPCGIPAEARAFAANVTVVAPTAGGQTHAYSGDPLLPEATVLSFTAGQTRASIAIVQLAGNLTGFFTLQHESQGSADYLVDVSGYFAPFPLGLVKEQAPDPNCDGVPDDFYRTISLLTGVVPGGCIVYRITLHNDGAASITNVVLTDATPPSTLMHAPPPSTTVGTISAPPNGSAGDVVASVGTLAAAQQAEIVFTVSVLTGTATGALIDNVALADYDDAASTPQSIDSNVVTARVAPTVDLTAEGPVGNGAAVGVGKGPEGSPVDNVLAQPAALAVFSLFANNTSTGSGTDAYDLLASSTATFGAADTLPQDWSVVYFLSTGADCSPGNLGAPISNTGALPAGTSKLVCAVISVPDTASAGAQDVFFQAKSPASLALDVIHVQVTVQ